MVNYTDMRPGTLLDLVLVSVQRHCRGMCKQETVSSYVWLRRGVPSGAVHAKRIGAAPWWQLAAVEAAYSFDVGLIDGDPVLHPVPKALETGVSVRGVIVYESGAEQSLVFVLEGLREIKMVDCDMRLYVMPYQFIY